MSFLNKNGRRNVAAIVMAAEATLCFGFNTAGIDTGDQRPNRSNPHEERRRIEESRRESAYSQRILSDEIHTL